MSGSGNDSRSDPVVGGLAVSLNDRQPLSFDQARVFDPMVAHFENHIDRRGLGWRGHSPWLMARIRDGLDSGVVPPDPGLRLTIRRRVRWAPGLNLELVRWWYWSGVRDLGGSHARGHSMAVNLWAYWALQEAQAATADQLRFPGMSGGARRRRVAHTPLGAPERGVLLA